MNKTMNDCGLSKKTVLKIWGVFAQYAEVEKAILYGSRAMDNYRNGSDIDLTLEGDKLTDSIRGKIDMDLDDLLLPYGIDLSVFAHLNHAKFRDHIERVGVVFYDKSTDKKKVGWKIVKLEDVVIDMKDGGTPSRKKEEYFGGDINWAVVKDISPEIYRTKETLTELGLKNSSAKVWPVGSIIISLGATIGNVGIAKIPLATKQGLSGIVVDKNKILVDFLCYVLCHNKEFIKSSATGTTIKEVRPSKLQKLLEFPLPPLKTQEKIVTKLDKVFAEIETAIVATRQKRIEIAKLKTAALSAFLSPNGDEWKTVRLGDVVSYDKQSGQGVDLPYVGMENIRSASMQLIGEIKIPLKTSSTFIFNEQHVLFGRLRSYLQKVLIPTFEGQCSTEIFCLRPCKNIDRKYLAYWLLSPSISKSINATSTGARMPRANMKSILEFSFPFPSLEEQKCIAAKLDTIFAESDTADNATQVAEQNYTALKKSILVEAFDKTSDAI